MLNIVIPMAGRGSRFIEAGYETPKPFIPLNNGTPMIQRVVENLMPLEPHRFIFLARREHEDLIRKHMSFATNVIYVDEVTEGAACTVLLAKDLINTEDSLVIANSDQLVEWARPGSIGSAWISRFQLRWKMCDNIQEMINDAYARNLTATMAVFESNHPKWSYAKVTSSGLVSHVAEKKAISQWATAGIYWYREGKSFVKAAKQMIKKDIRVNNEFYVCPVFNEMSLHRIGVFEIFNMYGLGTPEDLEAYFERTK